MKTKLSQIWQSLGVNAKAILITLLAIISILVFMAIMVLSVIIFGDNIKYLFLFCLTYTIYNTYKFIKQWLQQNKES